jgi:hypothetical protein
VKIIAKTDSESEQLVDLGASVVFKEIAKKDKSASG